MTTPELDRILDAAPIGVVIYSADGKIVRANHAYLDMIGFSETELQDRTWQEITHPGDAKVQARIMEEVRKSGVPADFVKRFVTKAGRTVWARATYEASENDSYVVYVVPEPEVVNQTVTNTFWSFVVENYKTAAMLILTAFGSIWAQYTSLVVRIENAERRATSAEHDVEMLKPLLLKLRGEFNAERDSNDVNGIDTQKALP